MVPNLLSKNLKFLRKIRHLNQDQLAQKLGITRNKIASYESQNIEPKLNLLSHMASFFDVRVDDLISRPINNDNYAELRVKKLQNRTTIASNQPPQTKNPSIIAIDPAIIEEFVNKNLQISKMIEGFEAYHRLRKEQSSLTSEDQQLMFALKHLMEVNRALIVELNNSQEHKM